MSSRNKGKHWERWVIQKLQDIFPDISRNWNAQSAEGGRDLLQSGPFCIEVKGGKSYRWRGVRKILDQNHVSANPDEWELSIVKPAYEDAYVMLPLADFIEMLEAMKGEGIL